MNDVEKPKKIQKMFDTFKLQISNSIANFEKRTNEDLLAYKKKNDSLYGVLVREFLVKLEQRVRMAEITSLSLVRLYVKKIYELEKKIDPSFNLTYEEFSKKLEADLNDQQMYVSKELEREDNESMESIQKEA